MSKKLTNLVPLFDALSDENRLKIVAHVQKRTLKCALDTNGECKDQTCIKDIEKKLDISLPTISYHVKELVNADLLTTKKKGRWSYLQIDPKHFKEMIEFLTIFKNVK